MSCYTSEQLLLLLHYYLLVSLSLLSLLAVCCFGHAEVECLPDQRSSLLTLKDDFSFMYSADTLLSWTPASNCCDWDGVSCDSSSGHVIGLDLSYHGLSGQIPIGISRLTRLISLDLSENFDIQLGNPNFQTLVRNLSQLRELHLDGVNISSDINWSETLSISLPRLQVLTLAGCNVTGVLPHNFFRLRNWTTLDLIGNQILCGLLRGFPENSHLELLRLSLTCINGSLSDSIGNLKYLRELQIAGEGKFGEGRRMLTGMIPSSIWNLTQLVRLGLTGFIDSFLQPVDSFVDLEEFEPTEEDFLAGTEEGDLPEGVAEQQF